MIVRPLDLRDSRPLLQAWALQRSAYAVEAALIGTSEIPGLQESVAELAVAGKGERFWGCWPGDPSTSELAGLVAMEPGPDSEVGETARISRLAVHPSVMRAGVGRRLVRCAVESAQAAVLLVSTGSLNIPARRLYESEGFVLVQERVVSLRLGGEVRVVEYRLSRSR